MKKLILILPIILLALTISVNAANCGGAVRCNCGDTVTSNHTMTYDLIGCNATRTPTVPGLKVSSRVTLDCNGHMITSRTGVGFGIWFSSIQYPGVKNCVINNFDNGIRSDSSDFGVITDNRFNYNTQTSVTFAGLGQSYGFTVKNNLLYDNGGYGLNMYSVTNTVVTGNEMAYNTMGGAYLDGSTGNTLYNNTFYDNGPWNANETSASTGNNWDSGTLGNYWSDFGSNPGYPNTYIIPGPGPGVDRRPRSALVNIDLAIYSNEITIPTNITEGDIVPIRFYVHNNGYAAANNVRINVLIDDNVIFPISNQYIGAHANLSLTTYWTATPGGHTLGIVVDPYNVIVESNEGNNAGGMSFFVEQTWYTYLWIPMGNWSTQQQFNNKAAARADFFIDTSPLKTCPNRAKHIYVGLDFVRDHCPLLNSMGLGNLILANLHRCTTAYKRENNLDKVEKTVGLSNIQMCRVYSFPFGYGPCNGISDQGESAAYAEISDVFGLEQLEIPAHELGHAYYLCEERTHSEWDEQRRRNPNDICPNPWSATYDEYNSTFYNHPCLENDSGECSGAGGACCGSFPQRNYAGPYQAPGTCANSNQNYPNRTYNTMGYVETGGRCGYSNQSLQALASQISCTSQFNMQPNLTSATFNFMFNRSNEDSEEVQLNNILVMQTDFIRTVQSQDIYEMIISDDTGMPVYSTFLPISYLTIYEFGNISINNNVDSNDTEVVIEAPYSPSWHTLKIIKNNTILLEENIGELLCNNNNSCNNFENYYSCEADCPNSGPDNTCQSEENGICDPDCAEGIDIDCGCRVPSDGLILRYNTILCDGTYNLENGIFIDSNNISITCNNCTLIGNKTSFGISLIQKNNVEVSNLRFVNFSTGVYLQNSTQNTIRNVRIQGHTTGINLLYSNSNEVYNNYLISNTNSTLLINSYSNNIHDNVIQNSIAKGAFLAGSQNNLFYRNIFNNNNQSAYEDNLSIGNAWNNSITGNNWSDFQQNPRYPDYYEIFGPGDGKDYLPNGRVLNTAPRFTPFNNITVREADRVLLDLNATDAENNTLTFYTNASAVLPSEFTFNSTTGLFDWTPTYLDQGNYTIFLNVTDGAQWDYAKLFITVLNVRVGGGSPIFLKPIKRIVDREIP